MVLILCVLEASSYELLYLVQIYEDISNPEKLKKQMTEFLDEYNNTPGVVSMDLVLFRDAIEHCMSM